MQEQDPAAKKAQLTRQLTALSVANYRRARWNAVAQARDLGMEWPEIAAAMGIHYSAANRMHRLDGEFLRKLDGQN